MIPSIPRCSPGAGVANSTDHPDIGGFDANDALHFGDFVRLVITITDDGDAGTLAFSSPHHAQMEVQSQMALVTVTVTRHGRAIPDGDVTVEFSSVSVTATPQHESTGVIGDYVETSGVLSFATGTAWSTFTVVVNDDELYEVRDIAPGNTLLHSLPP